MKPALVAILFAAAVISVADHIPLTLIPSGGMHKVGRFFPMHLDLTPDKPAALKKSPPLANPKYGLLTFGHKDHIAIVDEEPEGLKLFLDANGNGDLTDDPPGNWQASQYKAQDGKQYTLHRGSAVIDLMVDDKSVPVTLGVYKFDKADPDHKDLTDTLLYYSDYASEGQITLEGKTYHIFLVDWESSGYVPATGKDVDSGLRLAIDVNNNGQFEARGESFDPMQAFNVGGTSFKVVKLDPSGLDFTKATKPVDSVPLPPDVGSKAPSFTANTIDGHSIPFPGRYRGKLVMLFFWATSVPQSTQEIPELVKVYDQYHAQGFEVLGISADLPDAGKSLGAYVKGHNMAWPEIFEPFNARKVIDIFVVRFLPAAFLVDGDTGKIVAKVDSLRGDKLAPTIAKALAEKRGKGATSFPSNPSVCEYGRPV